MKNSSDTIGNRTCDLPTCSVLSQPTAPPAAYPLLEAGTVTKLRGTITAIGTRVLPLLQSVKTGYGVHPVSLQRVPAGLSSAVKWPECEAPRWGMSGAIPLLPHIIPWQNSETRLLLPLSVHKVRSVNLSRRPRGRTDLVSQ